MRSSAGAYNLTDTPLPRRLLKVNALKGWKGFGSRMMCGGYWNDVGHPNQATVRELRTYSSVWRNPQGLGCTTFSDSGIPANIKFYRYWGKDGFG